MSVAAPTVEVIVPATTEPQTPATPPAPTADDKRFTQAELDAIVKDRIDRERKAADEKRAKAEQDARDKALADQQEFKTLADQRASRITELEAEAGKVETITAERDAALAVVADLVKDELKAAPDFVSEAIADRSPVDQLRYIQKNRDKWTTQPIRGIPPGGNGRNTPQSMDELIDANERALRASGRYSI